MKRFPFFGTHTGLVILRITVAAMFVAHAVVRLVNNTIPQFSEFFTAQGIPYGTALVWLITAFEIIGGLLLAAGLFRRVISVAFILMLVFGIVLIHARLGWFVGEHGTGGMEYSVTLIAALLLIATTHHHQKHSLKHGRRHQQHSHQHSHRHKENESNAQS